MVVHYKETEKNKDGKPEVKNRSVSSEYLANPDRIRQNLLDIVEVCKTELLTYGIKYE